MPSSTVILGFGKLGRDLLCRMEHFLAPSDSIRLLACPATDTATRIAPVLEELLRVGRSAGGSPRLDVFVFIDVLEGQDNDLVQICSQISDVVASRYAVLFPSHLSPNQRNAALHVVAIVPALAPHPSTALALSRLVALESWSNLPSPYPLLSRIWLLSRHTTAGTLSDDALLTTCASFAGAFVELRDEDPIGQRLGHLNPNDGKFAFLSVASLDLRESKLRKYAATRAAYDGLRTLIERVARPVSDANRGAQAVASLVHQNWFAPFSNGGPAEDCRRLAVSFSGLSHHELPAQVQLDTFASPTDIETRHQAVFRAAVTESPRSIVDTAQLDQTLRALDRSEAETTVAISKSIANLVESEVGKATGLRRLPEVELGLAQIAASLRDQRANDGAIAAVFQRENAQSDAQGSDAEQQALSCALRNLPTSGVLRPLAGFVFLATAALALGISLRLTIAPPTNSPTTFSSPSFATASTSPSLATPATSFPKEQRTPLILSALLAVVAAGTGTYWVARHSRKQLQDAMNLRLRNLSDTMSSSSGGNLKTQAEAQLQLRKRRIRHAALAALDHSQSRLAFARRTLLDTHAKYLQELRDLGIKNPAAHAAGDDLSEIIGSTDALHGVLLADLSLLSHWIAHRRQVVDNDHWADRLIELTWSPRGIAEDIPCANHKRIDELCEWQVRPLQEQSILSDATMLDAAATQLGQFVFHVTESLAPICKPRDAHGDPSPGIRLDSLFAVAPQLARSAFDPVFRSANRSITVLWTPSQAARVLLFRTWEGYHLADIARGSGNPLPSSTREAHQ